jgi:hypothetical protein
LARVRKLSVDPEQMRRDRRRSEWRSGAEDGAQLQRQSRLGDLERRQPAIQLALDEYRRLPNPHAGVRLRKGGLRIDPPRPLPPSLDGPPWPDGNTRAQIRAYDLRTRKPLGRLVGYKGHSLNTYLAMIYTLQAEGGKAESRHPMAAKEYDGDVPWSTLCGRHDSSVRARRERMRRDVEALERAGLVRREIPSAHRHVGGVRFLSDDGAGEPYTIPEEGHASALLVLPSSFFTNGWHLVLTPQEIILWLAIRDAYDEMKDARADWAEKGVPLTQHHRWSYYGISGEAYGALHELEEFGLITVHDAMPTRTSGKFTPPTQADRDAYREAGHAFSPVPYQLRPAENAFGRPAIYTVSALLDGSLLPPRMTDSVLTLAGLTSDA